MKTYKNILLIFFFCFHVTENVQARYLNIYTLDGKAGGGKVHTSVLKTLGLHTTFHISSMRTNHFFIAKNAYVHANAKIGKNVFIHENAVIHANARLEKKTIIGANAVIGENSQIATETHIGAQTTIGKNTTIGAKAYIEDGSKIGDHVTIGKESYFHKNVTIGNYSLIGCNVFIGENTTVTAQTIIGYQAIINKKATLHEATEIENDVETTEGFTTTATQMRIKNTKTQKNWRWPITNRPPILLGYMSINLDHFTFKNSVDFQGWVATEGYIPVHRNQLFTKIKTDIIWNLTSEVAYYATSAAILESLTGDPLRSLNTPQRPLLFGCYTSLLLEDPVHEEEFCCICWENRISHVVLPCGHFAYCRPCIHKLNRCSFCRTQISERMHYQNIKKDTKIYKVVE